MPLPGYFSVRTLPRFSSNRSTKGSALRFEGQFEGQDGVGSKQFFLYAKFLSSLLLLPYSFLREIERAREKRDKTRPERRGGRRTKLTSSVSSRARRRKRVFFSFALKAMWVFSNLSLWGVGRSGKGFLGRNFFLFFVLSLR